MPNRRRFRRVMMPPRMEGFKPFGIPMRNLGSVVLLFEEFEAIRLTDYENLTQAQAARRMNISRPTFTRIYERARKNIAEAFVEGKAILIHGGHYITDDFWYRCMDCNEVMITLKPITRCRKCDSEKIVQLNKHFYDG